MGHLLTKIRGTDTCSFITHITNINSDHYILFHFSHFEVGIIQAILEWGSTFIHNYAMWQKMLIELPWTNNDSLPVRQFWWCKCNLECLAYSKTQWTLVTDGTTLLTTGGSSNLCSNDNMENQLFPLTCRKPSRLKISPNLFIYVSHRDPVPTFLLHREELVLLVAVNHNLNCSSTVHVIIIFWDHHMLHIHEKVEQVQPSLQINMFLVCGACICYFFLSIKEFWSWPRYPSLSGVKNYLFHLY